MKAVILAGGIGSRISEESSVRPKPLVEIGGRPMIWHIMKIYSAHNVREFIVCLGYKGYMIKEYFANYCLHMSDVTFDMARNSVDVHQNSAEPWRVTLVDTGDKTMTGGRLKRVAPYLEKEEAFCFTYGDGLGNIDITAEIDFHRRAGGLVTMVATQPPGRFGALQIDEARVTGFSEKPQGDGGWINGGFFVCHRDVFEYLQDDNTIWEREPLERIARAGKLTAFRHDGFWQPMDTLREKNYLEELWNSGRAPWKIW